MKVNIYNIEADTFTEGNYFVPSHSERRTIISPFEKVIDIEEIIKRFPALRLSCHLKSKIPADDISPEVCTFSKNTNIQKFLKKIFEISSEEQYDFILLSTNDDPTKPINLGIKIGIFEGINDTEILKNISEIKNEEFEMSTHPMPEIINFLKRFAVEIMPCENWDEFKKSVSRTISFYREVDDTKKKIGLPDYPRGSYQTSLSPILDLDYDLNNRFSYPAPTPPYFQCK